MTRNSMIVIVLGALATCASFAAAATASKAKEAHEFKIMGAYVEGCSCSAPCPCQLSGVSDGCEGVGALMITSGKYMGKDIGGAKIAYATGPAKWVRIYVDAGDAQREAATAFAKAYYANFGPIEEVKSAKIEIGGGHGSYTLTVDGGAIMELKTQPILGGDGKSAIEIANIKDPVHPKIMMGKTVSGKYNDGTHSFTLSDSNSYFNDKFTGSGKI